MLATPAGRRRALDRAKKQLLVDAVARGATMTEAALTVGVSLRTVQREAQDDPEFDQELRSAHTEKPDPLTMMHSAARTHWRAAAWLLERSNPDQYGRRPAVSCTPFQFQEALKVVLDAALRLALPENRAEVYAELTAAGDTAFQAVFPNYGPCGRRLVERLPDTPLANQQRLEVLRNPSPEFIVADPFGLTAPEEPAAGDQQEQAPDPFAAPYLKPPALPGDRPQAPDVTPLEVASPSPPAPAGKRPAARDASPWNKRPVKPKPRRGDITPALPPSRIRNLSARSVRSFPSRNTTRRNRQRLLSPLSPKTSVATKRTRHDAPPRQPLVSREAAAVFDPEACGELSRAAQTRRERGATKHIADDTSQTPPPQPAAIERSYERAAPLA